MPRAYLDTNIAIYFVEQHATAFPALLQCMFAPDGTALVDCAISELVRMEARVRPMRHGDTVLLSSFDAFFATLQNNTIGLGTAVFDLATRLRANHDLKTPDALHLAAAIHAGCDEFWTNDRRLTNAAHDHLHIVSFNASPT